MRLNRTIEALLVVVGTLALALAFLIGRITAPSAHASESAAAETETERSDSAKRGLAGSHPSREDSEVSARGASTNPGSGRNSRTAQQGGSTTNVVDCAEIDCYTEHGEYITPGGVVIGYEACLGRGGDEESCADLRRDDND